MTDLMEDVIDEYKFHNKFSNEVYVYMEVRKGMYGFTHSSIVAYHLLYERFYKHEYQQNK